MAKAKTKRKKAKSIKRTIGKGGNYRPTKQGAGMTKKGVAAYRKANPAASLKLLLRVKLKRVVKLQKGANPFAQGR